MLPCWWGIIPGETRAQDVVSFFEPFASEISIGDTGIAVYFSTPPDEISDHPIAHSFQISAGIVTHMRIDRMEGAESFRLPLVLADYGQPDGVWIRTFNPNPYTQTSFSVITFYGRRGIVAYWQGSGDVIGDTIHGCIETGPSLRLWAPDPSIATIEDTSKLFDPILPGGELTLMQATGMDVEMFYERFKGIDDPVCIDTPTNLWYGWYDATPIATPSR